MNYDDIEKKTIESIKDIINPNPNFLLTLIKDKVVKIILTEPRASLKKVTIYGFDQEKTCAFKLDAKDELVIDKTIRISEYLNPNAKQAINRGCDGIIFTYLNGIGYVFICEMKSEIPHKKDYIPQFRNSYIFVKFIFVKCFASRKSEKKKAFQLLMQDNSNLITAMLE